MKYENDRIEVRGKISMFYPGYSSHGEIMRKVVLDVERNSGTIDKIPVVVPERLYADVLHSEDYLRVNGRLSSYNERGEDGKTHLKIFVFPDSIAIESEKPAYPINNVTMLGYLCKPVQYRKTPLGREIADLLLAVNLNYNRSVYIPCIVWGRNAKWASDLCVGDCVKIEGRFQSREYTKNGEIRTVYEVSVSSIERVEEYEEDSYDKQ